MSDPSLADRFFLFFVIKSLYLTSKLGKHLRSTKSFMYSINFLSQLRKILILLIRSHCKNVPLPTIQTRKIAHICIVGNGQILQCEQRVETKSIFIHVHNLVLLRCLPSLDVKYKLFVYNKRGKNCQSSAGQTRLYFVSHCALPEFESQPGHARKLLVKVWG